MPALTHHPNPNPQPSTPRLFQESGVDEIDKIASTFEFDVDGKISWTEIEANTHIGASPIQVPPVSEPASEEQPAGSLREAFNALEPDAQDRIDSTGLRELIKSASNPLKGDVQELLDLSETGESGLMSLQEFVNLALRLREKAQQRRRRFSGGKITSETIDALATRELSDIKAEFLKLDTKRQGMICRSDLSILLKKRAAGSSTDSIDLAVTRVLTDLGVSREDDGISLEMYQDMLCGIKYDFLVDAAIKNPVHNQQVQELASPRRSNPRTPGRKSTGRNSENLQTNGYSPENIVKAIMKNASMIEEEELNFEGWTQQKEEKGITLWTRKIEGTEQLGVKVVTTMPVPALTIYEKLTDPKTELSAKSGKDETIERLGEGLLVRWSCIKVPLLENSDFVNGEYMGEFNGGLTYSFSHVEHPKGPIRKNHIRGRVLLGGWRITEEGERTRVTCISVCDLNRPVPRMLAEYGTDQSLKSVKTLRNLIKKDIDAAKKKATKKK